MKKKSTKKETAKKKPDKKKPARKKPAEKQPHLAKCPDCGYENPVDAIYCGKCANMIILKRQDQEPPPELIPEPPPEIAEELVEEVEEEIEEEPADLTKTIESPTDELATGTTFAGRYQIIEELGKGGMGRVYKALDKEIDEKVALKLIRPEIASNEKMIRRFRKELKTARQISNKNVCRMYDIGIKKGTRYITMEYVSGEDLKSSMKRMGQFTVGKAVFTAKQICEGLAEAHKLGIVHRDLKPQNIMIDEFGNVRIMDFGIARTLKSEDITKPGEIIGTRVYMSPEQTEAKDVDQRSDIYSVGLILYEMLANRLPFEEDIPLSVATRHMDRILKGPREYNPQVPEDLNRLILKCLEKDKDKRYQSTEELFADLDKIDSGISTAERVVPERLPSTSREITVKFDLQKLLVPGVIAVAVIIIGVLIWQLFLKKGLSVPEGKPSLAVMYFKNNTGDANLDHWREMIADSFVADLNQSKYIDVMSSERLFQILGELNQLKASTYSSNVLKQVAFRGAVNHILVGDYAKAGETIRIHVNLLDVRRDKTIASESEEGTGEESIFPMVDRLTKKIKERFDLTDEELADDLDREVAQITTTSPEAFKYYVEGRRKHIEGEYRQSIQLMERAVAIDPEFAMAYRSLSVSYSSMGLSPQRTEYIQKAMELSDRLSERELYQIQGDFFYESEETYDQAVEAYTKLLNLYPDDTTAGHNLALIYYNVQELDRALEHLERSVEAGTEFVGTYTTIADVHMMKGQYDKAEEILRYYLENVSNNSWVHQYLVFNYICQRQFHIAKAQLDIAVPLAPTHRRSFYLKGVYNTFTETFLEAEKEFPKATEDKEAAGAYLGYHGLANVSLFQGRFRDSMTQLQSIISFSQNIGVPWVESQARSILGFRLMASRRYQEALREFNKARDMGAQARRLDLQRLALHYKGLAYLRMRSRTRALRTAEELKTAIEGGIHQKEVRRYHHLMGLIELDRKKFPEAIEHLETALTLLPAECSSWTEGHIDNNHALYLDSLASAYYRSGDLEKAVAYYEKLTMLTTGRFYFGSIYAKSFYTLGRICQQLGNSAKAEENYNKFLALWFNADSNISEVSDAQKRLSGLNRIP
ncbi:MAG: protein kinase [Candidatus Aminicenantes bacterium]|nr:MAG: protein kinase [Candidatus Aminicenantes bacterium]